MRLKESLTQKHDKFVTTAFLHVHVIHSEKSSTSKIPLTILKMQEADIFKTLVRSYQTTRRHVLQDFFFSVVNFSS